MPVIKSAKKKLRKDKKRTARNKIAKNLLKTLFKKAQKSPSEKIVKETIKAVDKAAKNHIIHKNKAARIKSTLSKLFKRKSATSKPPVSRPKKATSKNL